MTTPRDVLYHGQPANVTGRDPDTGKLDIMVRRPKEQRDAGHGPSYRVVCDESEVEPL